ncbi:MAG: hypothetical protein P9M15_00440, partial [Candidatus Electryoneaceae bacterium]|nr:hypothetical protein [Candidatus Electryoneaceae bacterium]
MNQTRKQKIARCGWTFVILSSIALMVSFGRVDAKIGFRRTSQSEQLRDPSRTALTQGLSSTVSDDALVDTTLSDTTVIDTIHISRPPESRVDVTEEPREPDVRRPSPLELEPVPVPDDDQPELEDQPEPDDEDLDDAIEELPHRPTRIFRIDLPVEMSVELDTTTGYVLLKQQLYGVDMPIPGAIAQDAYIDRATDAADQEAWRQSVMDRLPSESDAEGTGINISIPVFRSKRAQRIFGGANIGLNVSGSIKVDGSMRVDKREELQQENINPTSYQFKVNQTQQFIIKGKVGEKITVEIDQNSERLFEFENNLKVIYQGYEDEIIQTIQAGNVDLSLRGGRLASASAKNMGLFGFKTISQVGPLKLTTIASLEKGEKKKITIEGGAETGAPIRIKPNEFVQGRYFYLDAIYRERGKRRLQDFSRIALPGDSVIIHIDVYRSISPYQMEDAEWITGWALYDPDLTADTLSSDKEHQPGNFRRLQVDIDYSVNRDLGYIRLRQSVDTETILAVAYTTQSETVGDPDPSDNEGEPIILKLLRPANPQPSDSTWNLMWRNVYDLGSFGIDSAGFEGKITATIGGGTASDTGIDTLGQARSYIEMFGIDHWGIGGGGPDNIIDNDFIDYSLGELIFPDVHPFAPEGWILDPNQLQGVPLPDSVFSPDLYTTTGRALNDISSDFRIEVKYKSVSAVYDLGYNVLEGSEEIYRNGNRLNR